MFKSCTDDLGLLILILKTF